MECREQDEVLKNTARFVGWWIPWGPHAQPGERAVRMVLCTLKMVILGGLLSGSLPGYGDELDEFDEFEEEIQENLEATQLPDPLEPLNRAVYWVNDKLYFWAYKPVALGYNYVVPEKGRISVGNFFSNVQFPLRFINNVLQFKWKGAGVELGRFGVNSTVGILGLFDPAEQWWGGQPAEEDFGQTLAWYGVGPGFAVHLPLSGPSNLRDAIGRIPEYFVDPLSYIDPLEVEVATRSYDRMNYVSLHLGFYEDLKDDAIDPYLFLHDAYEQRRQKQIEE